MTQPTTASAKRPSPKTHCANSNTERRITLRVAPLVHAKLTSLADAFSCDTDTLLTVAVLLLSRIAESQDYARPDAPISIYLSPHDEKH